MNDVSRVICPYCGAIAPLIDSIEVYGTSYGMIYRCQPCDAHVGVHKNSGNKPLGVLANGKLRNFRKMAHAIFDPLWRRKMLDEGCPKHEARNAVYAWLAGEMGISRGECHIGMMDEEQCQAVIDLCYPYHVNDDN